MRFLRLLTIAGTLLILMQSVTAAELIANGGFETGSLTGWTATSPAGAYQQWTVSASGFGGGIGVIQPTQVTQGTFNAWNGVTSSPAGTHTLVQQVTLPAGQISILRWSHRYQMDLTSFCGSSATCGTATFAVEILNTSNTLLGTMYTITTPSLSNTNTGWTSWQANLSSLGGQTIRLRFRTVVTAAFAGPGQLELDGVSINALPPTAASVTISGRATKGKNVGISGASITIVDSAGNPRTTVTNPLGYYWFDGVEADQSYVVTASKKGHFFVNNPRLVNVTEEMSDIDFIAP